MIEIIEAGTKKKVRCNNCGALLSYERSDVKTDRPSVIRTPFERDNKFTKEYEYIICPQCKKIVYL